MKKIRRKEKIEKGVNIHESQSTVTQTSCRTIQEQIIRCGNLKGIMSDLRSALQKEIITAIVFSRGCQLACRIFLLKSSVSNCMASLKPPTLGPFFKPGFPPGNGPPIFLALKADLSACSTTSLRVSVSYIRK